MKGKTLLCLALVASMLLGVFMIGPVGAQSTTIGVEPDSIVDIFLGPGSTFTVDIWVRNLPGNILAAVGFVLQYNTMVLTAVPNVTYGGIFGPTYFLLSYDEEHNTEGIFDDAAGTVEYGVMQAFGEPPVGDGKVATITFSVDSVLESSLNLYETKLGDANADPIDHTALNGYFRNTPAAITYSARLKKKSAWPEHHHYSMSKDEDASNDLFAIVANDGDAPVWVQVNFTITDATGTPFIELVIDKMWLTPGQMVGDKSAARINTRYIPGLMHDPATGRYYATAKCLVDADSDGVPETQMGKPKTFSFNIVS